MTFFHKKTNLLAIILLIFIILIPKAGIKINNIPITFGYVLLIIMSILSIYVNTALIKIHKIGLNNVLIFLLGLPFLLLSSIKLYLYGFVHYGFFLSFFMSLFIIPFIFLITFYHQINNINIINIIKQIKTIVYIIAVYGIFLFFYKTVTGKFIEIPFVTVNYHDLGMLETTKSIDRGGIFKLISTYNNGNLYGLCVLMLLPLYCTYESSIIKKTIVKFSLILTLSRTIWIGLLIYEILSRLNNKKIIIKMMKMILPVTFVIIVLFTATFLIGKNLNFIFDTTLGTRISQFTRLSDAGLLYLDAPFSGINEVVYASIAYNFGWLGLFFFSIYIISPLFLFHINRIKENNLKFKKSIFLGMLIYLIVSFSDGAILYIPIMAIYWWLAALLLSKRQSFEEYESCHYTLLKRKTN